MASVPPASSGGVGEEDDFSGPSADADRLRTVTEDQTYAARQNGMPYYEAFCVDYVPVTDGGRSQCADVEVGTVDGVIGECIGPDAVPRAAERPGPRRIVPSDVRSHRSGVFVMSRHWLG